MQAVYQTPLPDRLLQIVAPDAALPATHPAFQKGQIDGKATAYVCVGMVCSLPIIDPDTLRDTLEQTHQGSL